MTFSAVRTSRRALPAPALVLLLGLAVAAQERPALPLRAAPELVADLARAAPEAVAWAAYDARRLGDRSLVVPLQRALRAQPADGEPLAAFAALFVLDALAGLEAKVPAAALLPWLDDPRAGPVAFLLLARQPQLHEAELFAAFRGAWPLPPLDQIEAATPEHPALRVQALGNLLCAQKTPGFAAWLLAHTDLDLRATVVSPGRRSGAGTSRWGTFRAGPELLPAGLPPLPVYTLLRTDRPGRTDCLWTAPGPIEVGIARRQLAEEPPRARSPLRFGPPGDLAAALPWLCALAGARAAPPTAVTVPFTGAEACARQIGAAHEALRAFRSGLLQDLVAAKALGEEDAARLGKVEVRVHVVDERTDRTVPLPELPAAGPR